MAKFYVYIVLAQTRYKVCKDDITAVHSKPKIKRIAIPLFNSHKIYAEIDATMESET